jgi:hypothetical protein
MNGFLFEALHGLRWRRILAMALAGAGLSLGATFAQTASSQTDQLATFYPSDALAKGIAGQAVLICKPDRHFKPKQCTVESEEPKGLGFGSAALRVAATIPANETMEWNGKWNDRPVTFKFAPNPTSIFPPPFKPLDVLRKPDFRRRPNYEYLSGKYYQLMQGPVGYAKLKCIVTVDGKLDPCEVAEETRPGLGAAALDFATKQEMNPRVVNGVAVGGASFIWTVNFGMP